jgi:hypothetical protein
LLKAATGFELDLPAPASQLPRMDSKPHLPTTRQGKYTPEATSAHSADSNLREKIIEHLLIGDLLRCLWRKGIRDVEVLRSEVDRSGYDLVLEARGVVRHIQLKSSHKQAKTASVNAHVGLNLRPSACVIWILFDPDTMELGPYLWFGAAPGQPIMTLGEQIARHSKGNSKGYKTERANHRVVKRGRFEVLTTIDDIARRLVGIA